MRDLLKVAKELNKLTDELMENLEAKNNENKVELSALQPGEVIVGDSGTEYIVLEQFGEITAIISRKFMLENVVFDENEPDFSKSNVLREINDKCKPIIVDDFGADNIMPSIVNFTTVDNQSRYEQNAFPVRLITFDEARQYNNLIVNEELDDYWWTLTPWSTESRGWKYSVTVVSPRGIIRGSFCNDDSGVRPFLYLKSNIFVSKGE